jgi:signal transduction histidine kinase
LKLGLIVFAGAIALASLWYTQRLVDRLRDREQAVIQLWADAQAQVARAQQRSINPYQEELRRLEGFLREVETFGGPVRGGGAASAEELRAYRRAINWAQSMPPTGELNFILNEILEPDPFSIPAIITDSLRGDPLFWRNVSVPDTLTALAPEDSADAVARLRELRQEMDATYEPIPIRIDVSGTGSDAGGSEQRLTQFVHYDESRLVKELRIFPWIQLLFVGLFIGVGYLGFSYVRRSEQSNLWVGMAREAAHQLGTPISSLMGWVEVLRMPDLSDEQRVEAVEEIENDVERLQRVANRFSDIGSMPKLERQSLAPIIEQTAAYIRRRLPQRGAKVTLEVDVPEGLEVPVNEELFAWVIENLLKNALDAIDDEGRIALTAGEHDGRNGVWIEVEDTGSGIERSQWKNVFRPGYSTKKRGWGLGLSLARRVIEDYHGGTLRLADSTVGEGSTFRVELPEGKS